MNVAGVVKPFGNIVLNVNGPVAGAVPIFASVTGICDVTPSVKVGIIPTVVVISGFADAAIGAVGETGADVLFAVTVSFGTGVVVAVILGVCPAVPTAGVTGKLNTVFAAGARPVVFGLVQVTV